MGLCSVLLLLQRAAFCVRPRDHTPLSIIASLFLVRCAAPHRSLAAINLPRGAFPGKKHRRHRRCNWISFAAAHFSITTYVYGSARDAKEITRLSSPAAEREESGWEKGAAPANHLHLAQLFVQFNSRRLEMWITATRTSKKQCEGDSFNQKVVEIVVAFKRL